MICEQNKGLPLTILHEEFTTAGRHLALVGMGQLLTGLVLQYAKSRGKNMLERRKHALVLARSTRQSTLSSKARRLLLRRQAISIRYIMLQTSMQTNSMHKC